MSQLLALSFDVSASPSIWFRREPGQVDVEGGTGWGLAWYPGSDVAAVVVRDPRPVSGSELAQVLRDWDRFRGTIFVCHSRGAAKRPTEQDTHPFKFPYGGRDFVFAHNGWLDPAAVRKLPLGAEPLFEPVGTTDSEHAFCWLLTKMRETKARKLADVGYGKLHRWFQSLNKLGTLNVILSDGEDIVVYQDQAGYRPLHACRLPPPHKKTLLESRFFRLDHSDPTDSNRTLLLVSTTPLGEGWTPRPNGSLLVVRRGAVVWSSEEAGPAAASGPGHEGEPSESDLSAGDDGVEEALRASAASSARSSAPQSKESKAPAAPPSWVPPALVPVDPTAIRRYRVFHSTEYNYEKAVERSVHTLRLQPLHGLEQRVLDHRIDISVDCSRRDFEDVFGNRSSWLNIDQPYKALAIVAASEVEVRTAPILAPRTRETIPLVWMPWQRQMMTPFLLPPELPETQLRELSEFAMSFAERQNYDVTATLEDINQTIRRDFSYVQKVTSNETTPFEVYVSRRGVCQDFANLFICLARLLGVPARYRVGYIYTGANYDNHLQSEASHAWAEVYLPWIGWRGFDPTNGIRAGLDHVAVAAGRNYRDATPTSGTLYKGGGTETLKVSVKVEALE